MKPIEIEYNGKIYIFSIRSLIFYITGAILFPLIISYINDYLWLHEMVSKQAVFFLNLFTGIDGFVFFEPKVGNWFIDIPERFPLIFTNSCAGVQPIAMIIGIIIFIPSSQNNKTKKDIWRRKIKSLIISSIIYYVMNIIRLIFSLYLYWIGYPWDEIDFSLSLITAFITVIIVVFLFNKWIPEFMISFYYTYLLIKRKIEKSNKINSTVFTVLKDKIKRKNYKTE